MESQDWCTCMALGRGKKSKVDASSLSSLMELSAEEREDHDERSRSCAFVALVASPEETR